MSVAVVSRRKALDPRYVSILEAATIQLPLRTFLQVCNHHLATSEKRVRREEMCFLRMFLPQQRVLVSRPRRRKDEGEVHPCHVEAVRKETCISLHIRDAGTQTRQRMGESGLMCPEVWNENARPSRSACVSRRLLLGNVFVNTSNERASIQKKPSQQTPLLSLPSNNNQSCGSIPLQRELVNL